VFPVEVDRRTRSAPAGADEGAVARRGPASLLPAGAVEAAVPGALAGAAAGLLAGVLSGGTFGAGLAGLLFGFIIGFAAGTAGGGLLGACGWLFREGATLKPGLPMTLFGAVVGCVTATVIAGLHGLPCGVGAAAGAAGANLWALVCSRVDSPAAPRSDVFAEEGLTGGSRNGTHRNGAL
jgi:hypothetical protein